MSQEPKITSQNIADIINGIQITPEQAQQNRRLNADLPQQPAVDGWEEEFAKLWAKESGLPEHTTLIPFLDFIRSQITKAKEEERRVTIVECVGVVGSQRIYDREDTPLTPIAMYGYNQAIDEALQAIKSLLPTGDNKQGT